MNLETLTESEVSQKEKNKYCILMRIYEIKKNGTDETICKAEINTQTEITYYGHQGEEGEVVRWIGRLELIYTQYWNFVYNR